MPKDFSNLDWLVIVCSLFLGFGLVRIGLALLTKRQRNESRRDNEDQNSKNERKAEDAHSHRKDEDNSFEAQADAAHWTAILDLPLHASVADIQAAYRRKMAQYHPDKVATLGPELKKLAEQMAKRVNQARDGALRDRG